MKAEFYAIMAFELTSLIQALSFNFINFVVYIFIVKL